MKAPACFCSIVYFLSPLAALADDECQTTSHRGEEPAHGSSMLQAKVTRIETQVPDDEDGEVVAADEPLPTETSDRAFEDYISHEAKFDNESVKQKFIGDNKAAWEKMAANIEDEETDSSFALLETDQVEWNFRQYLSKNMRFDNQSAMDMFVAMHLPSWRKLNLRQPESMLQRDVESGERFIAHEHISHGLLSSRASCPKQFSGQYFKERVFLCQNSFTGVSACSEPSCHLLASFIYGPSSAYQTCHSIYYSNAEGSADQMGMCRCLPSNQTTWRRFYSSSGNNIYNCYSR